MAFVLHAHDGGSAQWVVNPMCRGQQGGNDVLVGGGTSANLVYASTEHILKST
jgi:hypothetical protein